MLSQYNVLVLDEPGNHLDVETVDSLAEALLAYKGTVIFTSHDRYFMKRMATSIIEVRDGRVVNYLGDYEAYLYAVNKEIEEGERETATRMSKAPAEALENQGTRQACSAQRTGTSQGDEQRRKNDREARRAEETREHPAHVGDRPEGSDAAAQRGSEAAPSSFIDAEERWCVLQEELGLA